MRTNVWALALAAAALALPGALRAEDATIVGPVTHIEVAGDGKSADATVKDNNTGKEVTVKVTDDLTLDKFKDKRIGEGDEVRARFDKSDGRNASKSFRKTAGC